jgi:hypothetical protein
MFGNIYLVLISVFFKNYKDQKYIITDKNFNNLMIFICNKKLIPLEARLELKEIYNLL